MLSDGYTVVRFYMLPLNLVSYFSAVHIHGNDKHAWRSEADIRSQPSLLPTFFCVTVSHEPGAQHCDLQTGSEPAPHSLLSLPLWTCTSVMFVVVVVLQACEESDASLGGAFPAGPLPRARTKHSHLRRPHLSTVSLISGTPGVLTKKS